jgi:molybdopterin converting factor small subunit
MQIKINAFGQISELITVPFLDLDPIIDTDQLKMELLKKYPLMAGKQFVIAVDKKIVLTNTPITEKSEIALLPPFSGG